MNPSVKAALILVVVFAIGGLSGYVVNEQFDRRPTRTIGPGLDPFRMERGVVEHIENRLSNQYKLTEEQRAGVRTILNESQKLYESLYSDTRPSLDQIRRAQQAAIRELMTDEQKEKFEKWLEERRKRWEARANRGERGPRNGDRGPRPERMKGPPPEKAGESAEN